MDILIGLGFVALTVAGVTIPLGVITCIIYMINGSVKFKKIGLTLLLTGCIALLASGTLCSVGAMFH